MRLVRTLRRSFSELAHIRNSKRLEDIAPMSPTKLGVSQLSAWIHALKLKEWEMGEDQKRQFMKKTIEFKDFRQAFLFMRLTAAVADKLDHHPEWFNVYNKVNTLLSTHTVNGLTCKDMILAFAMEEFAKIAKNADQKQLEGVYSLSPEEESAVSRILEGVSKKTSDLK